MMFNAQSTMAVISGRRSEPKTQTRSVSATGGGHPHGMCEDGFRKELFNLNAIIISLFVYYLSPGHTRG